MSTDEKLSLEEELEEFTVHEYTGSVAPSKVVAFPEEKFDMAMDHIAAAFARIFENTAICDASLPRSSAQVKEVLAKVKACVAKNPQASSNELRKMFGAYNSMASQVRKELVDEGVIVRLSPQKYGFPGDQQ